MRAAMSSTACLLKNEPASYRYFFMSKRDERGGAAKASLNRAPEFDVLDPKPGDLCMTRMKVR